MTPESVLQDLADGVVEGLTILVDGKQALIEVGKQRFSLYIRERPPKADRVIIHVVGDMRKSNQ